MEPPRPELVRRLPRDYCRCDGPAVRQDCPGRRGRGALPEGHAGLPCSPRPLWLRESVPLRFDLLWLEAQDVRGLALIERRALLREHLKSAGPAIIYSEHLEAKDGEGMFRHACRLGLEGIVSKRATSRYRSGRCASWVKVKNPAYERWRAAKASGLPGAASAFACEACRPLTRLFCGQARPLKHSVRATRERRKPANLWPAPCP